MWDALRNFLAPPVFEGDTQKTRHARLLYYSTVIIFVFSMVLWWINLRVGTNAEKEQTWVLGLLSIIQIPAFFLIRAGYVNQISFFLLTMVWWIITTLARTIAGIHDVAIMVYIIVMMSAAILLGWRAAVGYTLLSVGAIWWLASLEEHEVLVPVIGQPYRIALDMTVIFLLAFVIIFFYIRVLTNAIKDAKREMSERVRVEAKLEKAIVQLSDEISERKQAQVELRQQAMTDFLTGLFNRRYFFEIAEMEFTKALRYERPLSIIIFDLDLFKDINDTYGHDIGDQALVQIGNLLRSTIRRVDTAARYGGEEFILLLPEMPCAKAEIAAERLRKLVEDTSIQVENDLINITISLGVAGKDVNEGIESVDYLISKADQALYKAKRAGRNRVVCHQKGDTHELSVQQHFLR